MSGGYPPYNSQSPQGYPYGPPPPQQQPYSPYGPSAPPQNPNYPTPSAPSAPYDAPTTKPPKENKPYGASAPPTAQPYGAPPQPYAPNSAQPYGAPPQPYGASAPTAQPYGGGAQGYGASSQPYGGPPQPYGGGAHGYGGGAQGGYGAAAQPYGAPAPGQPYGGGAQPYGGAPQPYGGFAPGTDPSIMACFQLADQDRSGMIDDYELQRALSSYNQDFSIRTVHLLMYNFTNSSVRKIGPKEFTALYYSLQNWRSIFERFDRDRSGKIDTGELREALLSLGFSVSPAVLDLLVSKFDKTGGKCRAIEYDNFIECCLTVKGLTEKFKEKDTAYSGSATFTYESFMLTVLPFLIA